MKTVTLKAIRKYTPCSPSWETLLASLGKSKADYTEVSLEYILDLLGLDDALWALRALPRSQESSVRLLVSDMVAPALEYTDDPRIAEAIRVAREYARGAASLDELDAARASASDACDAVLKVSCDAARDAGFNVAKAATWATVRNAVRYVAFDAAWAAAGAAVWDAARAEAEAGAGAGVCATARAVAGTAELNAAKKQEHIFRDWLRSES